jgi:hypothetical protein
MNKEQIIDFLLEHASANIVYRVKRDILQEPIDCVEMQNLQEKILELPRIKKTFASQKRNGFLGDVLHGGYYSGFDTNVFYLKLNGVEISNPTIQRAKQALLNWKDFEDEFNFHGGKAMDEHGRGGIKAIIADLMLSLGCDENTPHIQEQIEIALSSFSGALKHTRIDDFTKECTFGGQKVRYYIKGTAFPADNHLKLLNRTSSWRTTENLSMFEESYVHCKNLMEDYRGGYIYINCGHLVGPFNINWHDEEIKSVNDFINHPIDFAWWMRRLQRAEKGCHIDQALKDWIFSEDIISVMPEIFLKKNTHLWAIEPSWRKRESKLCDLYFPAIIALCNAN